MTHDVYLRYSDAAVVRTKEVTVDGAHTDVHLDLDAEGNVIGVEVLDVDTVEIDGQRVSMYLVPMTAVDEDANWGGEIE